MRLARGTRGLSRLLCPPDALFARLQGKFASFLAENSTVLPPLLSGQHPSFLVIACADSRVDPALLFEAKPGEMFVVRNVANIVPACGPLASRTIHGTSAAIEFAVEHLKVPHLIVCGHGGCAGIRALVERREFDKESFVGRWLDVAWPARQATELSQPEGGPEPSLDELCARCERFNVQQSISNLRTFGFISAAETAGRLQLIGAHVDLVRQRLEFLLPGGKWGQGVAIPPAAAR